MTVMRTPKKIMPESPPAIPAIRRKFLDSGVVVVLAMVVVVIGTPLSET